MALTTVYFIRHGEAEGNVYHRMHGQYDGPLTAKGREQLSYLKERFLNVPIDAVYSSDLVRAADTAAAVSVPKGLPIIFDPRLREFDFGIVEDMPWGNAAWEYNEPVRLFHEEPSKMVIPRGESIFDVRRRTTRAVWDIVEQNRGKTVAVASHGAALRAMMAALLGYGPDEFAKVPHCGNTAVSKFLFDGDTVTAAYIADNSHLPPDMRSNIGKKWYEPGKNENNDSVRFVIENPDQWKDDYIACREDAWKNLYGDLGGMDAEAFWEDAVYTWLDDHRLLQRCYYWDEPIGVLQMNVQPGRKARAGNINFCYLKPEYRYKGMGAQLIGQAVSLFRGEGFGKLQLCVSQYNKPALRLYERCGFVPAGKKPGSHDMLLVMEKIL